MEGLGVCHWFNVVIFRNQRRETIVWSKEAFKETGAQERALYRNISIGDMAAKLKGYQCATGPRVISQQSNLT